MGNIQCTAREKTLKYPSQESVLPLSSSAGRFTVELEPYTDNTLSIYDGGDLVGVVEIDGSCKHHQHRWHSQPSEFTIKGFEMRNGVVDRTSALARVSISRQYTTTLGVVDCMRQADAEGKSVWTWQEIYTVDISGKKNTNSEYDVHGDKKTCRDGDEGEEDDEELEYLGNIRIEANGESMRVRRRETDIHHKGYIQSRVYNSKYDMNLRGEMSTIRFAGIPSHFKSVVNREDPNTISSKHPIHTNRNDDGGKIVDTNMVGPLTKRNNTHKHASNGGVPSYSFLTALLAQRATVRNNVLHLNCLSNERADALASLAVGVLMTYVAPHMLSTVVSKRYIYDNPAMVKSLAEINMNRAQGSSSIARAISDLAEAITPSADSASNDSSNVDDNNGDDITGESNPTFFACGVTRQRKGVPSVQDILERRAKGVLDDPLSSTSAYASDNKDRDSSSRRYHYNPSNGDNIDLSRLDDGCGDDENARTHAREAYYVDLVPNKEKEYVVYDSMHNVYGFIESEGCFRKDNPIKWFASYGSFSIYKYDVCPSTSVVIKGHPLYKVEAARNYTTSLGVVDCMRKADNNGISTWTWQDLYCADVYTNTLGPIYASDASLSAVSMMDDGFKHTGVINVRLNGRSTRTRATLTECGSIKGEARDSQYTSRFNSKDAYIHYTTHNNRRTHGGATGPGGGGGSGGAGDDDGYEDGNGRNHDSDGDISSSVNYDMGRAIDGINIDLDVSSDSKSMSMQYIVHDGKREKETLRQVREHNSKKMSDEERKKTRTHAPVHPHANIAKTLAHTNLLHAKRDDGDHSIHTGTNIHTTHTNRRSQNHISGDHSDGSDDDGAVVSGLKARYVFTSSIIHRAVEDEDKRLHVYLCKPGELRADYFSADSGANDDHDHAERKDRSGVQYTNSRTNESESDETYTTHGSEHNDGHRENHGDSTRNARDSGDACIDPSLAILHSFLCYQLNPDRLVQLSTERYIADNPNINKLLVPTMQVPSAP